ncbi:MAG: 4Fe-4S dicluster domain-containing protein [Tepidisphaeraceae bacterium]
MSDDDKPVDRRHFFRQGLRQLLRPIAAAIEPLEQAARHFGQIEIDPPARPVRGEILRPPGALKPDQTFLDTCSRCGDCVRVCPAQCIKIDTSGARGGGAPYINPDEMPCVVCDGLLCMHECPSGALVPVPLAHINMGVAVWNPETCVRRQGEDCRICVERCPVGEVAIQLRGDRIHVVEEGCIGCGVCQHDCPTNPKSIVVISSATATARA